MFYYVLTVELQAIVSILPLPPHVFSTSSLHFTTFYDIPPFLCVKKCKNYLLLPVKQEKPAPFAVKLQYSCKEFSQKARVYHSFLTVWQL